MFKKVGMITVGVGAGLLVAAPFASAGEAHDPGHDGHGHHGEHHSRGGSDCSVNGGGAEANGGVSGDSVLGNAVAQLPVGGNNVGNIVCNDILNDNVSGNHVAISVLGSAVTPG